MTRKFDAIDVSHNNGHVDWALVKEASPSIRLVGAKASQGNSFTDPEFSYNRVHMDRFPYREFYHWVMPIDSPESQLKRFQASIGGALKRGEFVTLDIETYKNNPPVSADQGVACLKVFEAAYPGRVAVYIGHYYYQSRDPRYRAWPLWLPWYGPPDPSLAILSGAMCWQWGGGSGGAAVPGVPSLRVDSSEIINETTLKKIAGYNDLAFSKGTKYMPALTLQPIVADLANPKGGAWLLAADGSVYAFAGAPYLGGANGKDYFKGRVADHLELTPDLQYRIVATSGEVYGPGF